MRGPHEVAAELGIEVSMAVDLPFRVGSDGDRVIYCWDATREERDARVWEGIAQCVLTRSGVRWSERRARLLARELKKALAQKAS